MTQDRRGPDGGFLDSVGGDFGGGGAAGMAEVAEAEADAGGTAYDRRGSYTRTTVS